MIGPNDRGRGGRLTSDTTAVVLAGGNGTRLGVLTRDVCKPALPFGAAYRNIDFSLANCVNSGVFRVGVATQYKSESLTAHIARVWSPAAGGDRRFIAAWPASERAPTLGYRGTADAVFRNLEAIEKLRTRFVLILAGDHVYKMDYRPLLEHHCASQADVTIGCIDVPTADAHRFGILSVAPNGEVQRFVEKPKTLDELGRGGQSVAASMGIYVFNTEFLAAVLRRDAFASTSRHDFGADILPQLVGQANVHGYPFRDRNQTAGYWRDVGTPLAYWQAHMELLGPSPRLRLDDPGWPLRAEAEGPRCALRRTSANGAAHVVDSLLACDSAVSGSVRHSVVSSRACIGQGAHVTDSVVLPGAVIGARCRLHGVIVGSGCRVPEGTTIASPNHDASDPQRGAPIVVTAEDLPAGFAYASA